MRTMLVCAMALLVGSSLVEGGQDPKGDLAKLQGRWEGETKGKKLEFQFTKDTFTLSFGPNAPTFKGKIKINAAKKPGEIDLTITEGKEFEGKTSLGLYEVNGDTLKWVGAEPGKGARPTAFPGKEGETKDLYVVFKRVK